ncbi:aldo/keto reductase [Pseudenhygromyxa sp. WMMC2535]|uniref:aldo/keto reductase n=1 Tax=Pseudenhygromyxa sp. WMMC2535 TaxID=2712867 RepID=UPI0015579A81|nr:aldo/keto reductase [Pseudenhygromyxa sp. WMMC2535]NVB39469.1 aldo/keto reductase [Pseudenhygromyxa sp. WMMC2535]
MSNELRYRLLGRSGLRVSEICLGTMSFGNQWGFGADEATSHQVLDAFAEAGGNFLDTANKYHGGETEEIVGNWLQAASGRRDRTVVATKYTLTMDHGDPNAAGNHRKNLVRAVEGSLRRLQTDYIDLLWVHAWDPWTPWEETMRGLDDLVRAGKLLYVGVSDTPAWVVSAANVAAELRNQTPFVGLQIEYSLLQRTPERDLLPMAEHFGLSVLAWAPLGGGVLTGKYTRGDASDSLRKQGNDAHGRTAARNLEIARVVDAVADELGVTSAQVATAWVSAQGYRYLPIVGARKVGQITDTMGASAVTLSEAQLAKLDAASEIELGFPHDFLGSDRVEDLVHGEVRRRIDARPKPV